jgi:hypothetical protein
MSITDEVTEQVANRSLPEPVLERRRKPRIFQPFQVRVSGKDIQGETFEIGTVLDNMSTIGIYLKLDRSVALGVKLNMVIQLSTSSFEEVEIAKVAAETVVVRTEPLANGIWGLAMLIVKRRFI